MLFKALVLSLCLLKVFGEAEHNFYPEYEYTDDRYMHDIDVRSSSKHYNPDEQNAAYWNKLAESTIHNKLEKQPITNVAKNVIMFLGDGMSIPTLAAARAYLGQKSNQPGEETELSFEKFPYVGLSKTYCVDSQVADSACSATAYLGGVKGNIGTIGVTAAVASGDCNAQQNASNHVQSVAHWAQLKGKRTGVVTTTRVTHASPSGAYAHTASRHWEQHAFRGCPDIAMQLVHGETGKNLNVILGGGRGPFIPLFKKDEEGHLGKRLDGRNLIEEWKALKENTESQYVWNRTAFLEVPPNTEYLLGLFSSSHMPYNLDRDQSKTPSLEEMTRAAIRLLSQGPNGYFLFVEGGRIDQAHHQCKAQKALDETVEFAKAIEAAVSLTNIEDTLIVVTADHAHTMSVSGYPNRGNDILGKAGVGVDFVPYPTLGYANGLGYRKDRNGIRHDFTKDDYTNKDYRYPATTPHLSETHGGDDVGIYARGPWAHLLTGVVEQNVIAHVMSYASCVGEGSTACDKHKKKP